MLAAPRGESDARVGGGPEARVPEAPPEAALVQAGGLHHTRGAAPRAESDPAEIKSDPKVTPSGSLWGRSPRASRGELPRRGQE